MSIPSNPSSSTPAPVDTIEPVDQFYIRAWDDPIVEGLGYDPRSTYVEQFWLGVLGPSPLLREPVSDDGAA